jgi:hypothetical protein
MFLSLGLFNDAATSDNPTAQFEVTTFQANAVVQNKK